MKWNGVMWNVWVLNWLDVKFGIISAQSLWIFCYWFDWKFAWYRVKIWISGLKNTRWNIVKCGSDWGWKRKNVRLTWNWNILQLGVQCFVLTENTGPSELQNCCVTDRQGNGNERTCGLFVLCVGNLLLPLFLCLQFVVIVSEVPGV